MDLLFEANRLAGELANDLRKTLFLEEERPSSAEKRTIVAYSGHFQPFHQGHFRVYKTLVKKFGRDNVYITTTHESDEFENPLSYDDKKAIITKMFNIEEGKFQEVENPFVPKELLKKFSPKSTSFVTVVNTEDAATLAKSKYFEHYNEAEALKPYAEAGYYLPVPEIRGEVGNQSLTGQQIMQVLGSSKTKPEVKEKLFTALYGQSDKDTLELISNRAKDGADDIDGGFEKTKATGNTKTSKPGDTDASGQDNASEDEEGDDKTPPMQRMITNPDTGREIKVQSALKYPRWKPVYKRAEKVLKSAGIDRKDRVKEPEVNARYKARAKSMKKEDLVAYLGDTLAEQLHAQFLEDGVTLTVPGLGEVLLRLEAVEATLISEGGAAGHLAHPYEDEDLKFADLEEMISRSLTGTLDQEAPVTEKLDGQNIQFSYKNGKIVFARNTGHVKNKGATALDVDGVKDKFAGRGDLTLSFGNAADDLQAAINALPPAARAKMFKDGGKWVNLEIINPKTQNVIPYDKNILVFHNTVEYDANGHAVNLGQEEGAQLARAIEKVGAQRQKTYGIQGPQNIAFSDKQQNAYKARQDSYLKELESIRKEVGLSSSSTLGDYFEKKWNDTLDMSLKSAGLKLPPAIKQKLIRRWAFYDKSYNAREFKKAHPEFAAWFDKTEKSAAVINKDIRKPVEYLFLRAGADSLVRMTNFMSANNPEMSDMMKREVLGVIEALKSDPSRASETLNRELERLNSIGFDKITPTEGVVFIYNGKPYKLTGSFAPINQLMGVFKFGKGADKPADGYQDAESPQNKSQAPVAVYPGRFQPFHPGHFSVYKSLVDRYGKDNVFIGTSNKTDDDKSPFGFAEKQQIMSKMFGIPADKIVQVKNPYAPEEVLSKFPANTPFVTAVSEKDATRLAGGKYYRPLPKDGSALEGDYKTVGYYDVVPEFDQDVAGSNVSGTTVRNVLRDPKRSPAEKQKVFKDLYGKFDPEIFDLMVSKLSGATSKMSKPVAQKQSTSKKLVAKASAGYDSKILNTKIRNPETDNDILVRTALKYDKTHPAYKAAAKVVRNSKK
jgi:nicotinamide mononucleotide adenylyltransferase